MSARLSIILTVFIVALFSLPAFAWDDTGHKIAAYIAWQQMTPAVREKAIKLLLSAPEDSDLAALYPTPPDIEISTYPIGARSKAAKQRDFFMIASYWADIVRERKYPNRYKFHHGNWHYLDTFWRDANGRVEIVAEMSSDQENAVERLYFFDKMLQNPSATDSEKGIALAWILHLAGDIHQPLHASGRVTDDDPKGGDQGGNTFSLSPKDTPRNQQVNLHWYWDSIFVRSLARKDDSSDAEYLVPIAADIMKKYPLSTMQGRLSPGGFSDWQKGSFEIASKRLYPAELKRFSTPSEKYRKMALVIAEEQVALAGYRLGELLNRILAEPAATAQNGETCLIIRKVRYPVTQTNPSGQPLEIGLLNLCPANKGMVARPMYPIMVNGQPEMREYDVDRIFKTESEAREYAAKNGIKDISIN